MRMKKLLNSVLTVQRYEESPTRPNYFNESVVFFNEFETEWFFETFFRAFCLLTLRDVIFPKTD